MEKMFGIIFLEYFHCRTQKNVFGMNFARISGWSVRNELGGGVAAIVCDTTENTVRRGSRERYLVMGGVILVGSLSRRQNAENAENADDWPDDQDGTSAERNCPRKMLNSIRRTV